jgi:hypothetical protein
MSSDVADLPVVSPAPGDQTLIDPWKPVGVVRHGIFKGAALDIDHFRSATILTAQQATPHRPADGEILVANFRHDNRWLVARLRLDRIEDLIFHLEWTGDAFPGVHNQLRVVMKDGAEVTLEPQRLGDASTSSRLKNILLSSEGNFAPGTSARLRGGLEQASIAHMAMSMEQKSEIMSGGGKPHLVLQIPLRISDEEKRDVVLTYLRHATEVGTDEMFNLLTWNCASPLFQALDRTIDRGAARRVLALLSLSSMPHWAVTNLALRGLIDGARKLPNYFDEFPVKVDVRANG